MVTFRNAGRVGSIAFRRLPSKNRPLQSDQSEAEEPEHSDAFCLIFVNSFILLLVYSIFSKGDKRNIRLKYLSPVLIRFNDKIVEHQFLVPVEHTSL